MTRILLLTGLAGAGRTTAADILEDMGYFVMENLPAAIVSDVVNQIHESEQIESKIAVAVDIRDEASIRTLFQVRDDLREKGNAVDVVFFDADDDTIVRRFEQTRRPHPYISAGVLTKSIEIERELLSEVLSNSDIHIDTTTTNPTQLSQNLTALFSESSVGTTIVLHSFGFKHGTPRDADYVFDVRFLPNPFWDDELSSMSGLETKVQDYVRSFDQYEQYFKSLTDTLTLSVEEFSKLGKGFVSIAIGCTGGVHRSVTVAIDVASHFRKLGFKVIIVHRELDGYEL